MIWAVRQGTVLFSTMIDPGLAEIAMSLVAPSKADMLVACPAPMPIVFVGVFTLRKITSASEMDSAMAVEKKRLGARAESSDRLHGVSSSIMVADRKPSRALRTTSCRPGSCTGRCFEFQPAMRASSLSTTVTRMCGFCNAMTAAVGPPAKLWNVSVYQC